MENQERFHAIGDKLYSVTKNYLAHHLDYPTDIVVGINWEKEDIVIDSPSKMDASYEQFSIAEFITIDEKGYFEPRLF
ncbi:MAG: hypothetical protein J6T86_03770 [Bacteroidales bacterium]|nr:hypothetical protein [Bacteroidales bacterium]